MSLLTVILPLVMSMSCIVQFLAAGLAVRLIRTSGFSSAWILLASGFTVQGIRRIVALWHVLAEQAETDVSIEVFGLTISLFMLCGIVKFKPIFEEINQTRQTLLEEQRKLLHANRELETFVSTVAHDLRTPLTSIIGYAEHLKQKCASKIDEQDIKCLSVIESQSDKMTAMMEDLLVLARVGYVERPDQPVDTESIVKDVVRELDLQVRRKGVSIKTSALPRIRVPETFLMEIFKNLIGNALSYACDVNPSIEFGGEKQEGLVRFFVRDHGPGIPESEQERVFEMFCRGSTSKTSNGTGIGLAIVQKIAQLYGGGVSLETTVGGGCTFWVEIAENSEKAKESKLPSL